jgi:hypothetical protein
VLSSALVWFVSDAFRMVEESVLRLETDFDALVDDTTVHILRPSGFEVLDQLQEANLSRSARQT